MDDPRHTGQKRGAAPAAKPSAGGANGALGGAREISALTELVADILEATGLVPADRLSTARARAGNGSLAQALVEEGLASGEGSRRRTRSATTCRSSTSSRSSPRRTRSS